MFGGGRASQNTPTAPSFFSLNPQMHSRVFLANTPCDSVPFGITPRLSSTTEVDRRERDESVTRQCDTSLHRAAVYSVTHSARQWRSRTSNACSLTRKWHTRGLDSSDGVRLTSRRLQKGHLWNQLVHSHPRREEYCFYSDQRGFFQQGKCV